MKNKIHFINYGNEYYIFNCITYKFLRVPHNLQLMMDFYINNSRINSKDKALIKEFLDFLYIHKDFFSLKIDVYEVPPKMPIFSFCPTHNCNFQCKYCFSKNAIKYDGVTITTDIIDAVFKYMRASYNNYNSFRLEFVSGGEPLLNFDAIKYACVLADELKIKGININIFLVTNASLLTSEILKFLEDHNVSLGITFEGTEKSQNFLRSMKNGEKSYPIVLKNIKYIKATESLFNIRKNLWIISIITSYCTSLVDIVESCLELEINSAELRVARGDQNDELFLNSTNLSHFVNLYLELNEYILKNIQNNNYRPLYLILNNYDTWGKLIKRIICQEMVIYRCNAGVNKFAFAANGDIYPCDSFVGDENYKLGNVYENVKLRYKISIRKNVEQRSPCSECKYKYICGGDCYYNSIINNNDVQKSNTAYCSLMKELCSLAINMVLFLKKDEQKYNEIKRYLNMRDYFNRY